MPPSTFAGVRPRPGGQLSISLDRRTFLARGAKVAAGASLLGAAPGLVAACSSSNAKSAKGESGSGGGSGDLGTLTVQFSWIKNVEFAGEYFADTKGYYRAQGFSDVKLLAGGPNVQQDAVVGSGKAFIGISSPDITAAAINKGADLVIVGAQYQKNPFAVMSLAKNPIRTPEEMYGKKIGVQATNESVWNGFIKASGLDASKIKKVPVQFDPQGLVDGEVDGWFSFITNEPNTLKIKGIDTVTFLLNDNGYPYVSETYMVRSGTLKDKTERAKLKAALIAEIKGWKDAMASPEEAARLTVTKYGKDLGLGEAEQVLEAKAELELIATPEARANGLFTISKESQAATVKSLAAGGVDITAERLFDLSVLDEIYREHPELKG